jgi:hypothetical protein
MLDCHVPCSGLLNDDLIDIDKICQFKALFLADYAAMSDKEADAIAEYVSNGGNLLATGQTSAFDENAQPREDFALKELFACSYKGQSNCVADTYVRFSDNHQIYDDDIIGVIQPCMFHAIVSAHNKENIVADILCGDQKKSPGILVNNYGRGKVIYMPASLERTYVNNEAVGVGKYLYDRSPILRKIFSNSITWLTGAIPVTTEQPSGLWIIPRQNSSADKIIVHVLNMVMSNYDKSHIVRDVQNARKCPQIGIQIDFEPKTIKLLRKGIELNFRYNNNVISFTIPSITDYEAVLISGCLTK